MYKKEKLKMYLTILNDENPSYIKENAKTNIIILFEKQQKEIEYLKAITKEYEAYNCREDDKIVIASKEYFINGFFKDFLNDYISKDKIREKIEELENTYDENNKNDYHNQFIVDCVAILEELLQGGQKNE